MIHSSPYTNYNILPPKTNPFFKFQDHHGLIPTGPNVHAEAGSRWPLSPER